MRSPGTNLGQELMAMTTEGQGGSSVIQPGVNESVGKLVECKLTLVFDGVPNLVDSQEIIIQTCIAARRYLPNDLRRMEVGTRLSNGIMVVDLTLGNISS